jgi:hypothetical protein
MRLVAKESPFVDIAFEVANDLLKSPLSIRRGAPLLYQITVDNQLDVTIDPKAPRRGTSAFQTDLCVFEAKSETVVLPRVVLEFKTSITTHDVLTYSAKARKHKQVYPYVRYGVVASDAAHVAGRVFNHNESLDFCAAVADLDAEALRTFFAQLFEVEVAASRRLEGIFFGATRTRLFRSEIVV